jgi:hypothetical protein
MKDRKAVEVNRHHSLPTFPWLVLITILFAFRASLAGEEPRIQSFHQLTPSQGWALVNNHLLATDSAGTRWTEITPPLIDESIDGVFFLNRAMGWAVISRSGETPRLATTTDGGALWTITGLAVANGAADFINYGGIATISFADATHGWILLRSVSSINFSRGILLRTTTGGESWTRLANPPLADGLVFADQQVGWLTGGPNGNQSFLTRDGGTTWTATRVAPLARGPAPLPKQSQLSEAARADLEERTRLIAPDAVIARAQLNLAGDGWMEAVTGHCTGFKTGCSETSRLLAVNAGLVTEITPPTTETAQGPTAPTTGISAAATVALSAKLGFDQCSAGTVSQMSTWWTASPYSDANIYIGGSNRGCSQPTLNASWVTSIFHQGWHIIPTWVGPQAPCAGFARSISTNTTTAFNEGVSEATSAISAAGALGLSGSIVYYDMEHYDNTNTSCQAAVDSFISGWSHKLRSSGFRAGVYGSPFDMAAGWATVANVPDDVWIADWNGSKSTTGISPLSNSLWVHCQRLHQYQGGHNETWGGITFNIDNDSENGQVAAPSGFVSAACTT